MHPNLVLLEVADVRALGKAVSDLKAQGIEITPFFETDDDMGFTAAATGPLGPEQRKLFRKYRLWSAPM